MKTFKTILAWIDWSNNCSDSSYAFPNNLCSLFWRTLWSILALPIAYTTHLWNIFQPKIHFTREFNSNSKITMIIGLLIHVVTALIGGVLSTKLIESYLEWNWFLRSDPFLLNYIKVIGIGIIGGALIVIVIVIGVRIYKLYKYLTRNITKSTEPSIVTKVYKAIKDEYCPLIDWSDIK